MLTIGAISKALAFIPIAAAISLFPIAIVILGGVAAGRNSPSHLLTPQRYRYFSLWFIAALAILGVSIIGDDYWSSTITSMYAGIGAGLVVISFICLMTVTTKP